MSWRLHLSYSIEIVCTNGVFLDRRSWGGSSDVTAKIHVGTVEFRIDRPTLEKLRSDWSDSTTFLFLHVTDDKDKRIRVVHWLKKDDLRCMKWKERDICQFIRLKKREEIGKREEGKKEKKSTMWCKYYNRKGREREKSHNICVYVCLWKKKKIKKFEKKRLILQYKQWCLMIIVLYKIQRIIRESKENFVLNEF